MSQIITIFISINKRRIFTKCLKKQYYKINLNKIITNEKSLSYLTSQSALNKVISEKYYYKNCIFNSDFNYKKLQMSDINSDNSFKLNFKVIYNYFNRV